MDTITFMERQVNPVPIVPGYAMPREQESEVVQYEATWLEQKFVTLGTIIIVLSALGFSLLAVFV